MRRISKFHSWRLLKEYWASSNPLARCFPGWWRRWQKLVRSRIANAKTFGWLVYAAGFAIWLFGYLSPGHAPLFDWSAATPWWISSFVPNLEAEFGMALMFASMIPIYARAVSRAVWGNFGRLIAFAALLVFAAVTFAWWGFLAWFIWHLAHRVQ
jgi:hypothetical protein